MQNDPTKMFLAIIYECTDVNSLFKKMAFSAILLIYFYASDFRQLPSCK
jgi:hypothetical protein